MELYSLPSLCTRRSFTIAHKSYVAACRISTRLSPHPAQWQLAIKRHQESKHRKTTWLEWGLGVGFSGRARGGMCKRRLVALACAFQGDALAQAATVESRSFT